MQDFMGDSELAGGGFGHSMSREPRVKLARRIRLVERSFASADHVAVKWLKCLSFNRELAILSPAFADKASSNLGR